MMQYVRQWLRWLGYVLVSWGTESVDIVPVAVLSDEDAEGLRKTFVAAPSSSSTAVQAAFTHCGLPLEQFKHDFNLVPSGKIYEIIHYASETLNVDHRLRTVGDVIAFFDARR